MEIDGWIEGYKVRVFPWIDGKTIYVNVAYYQPGQRINDDPAWEKTVYVTDNQNANRLLTDWLHSFVVFVARMQIGDGQKVVITP